MILRADARAIPLADESVLHADLNDSRDVSNINRFHIHTSVQFVVILLRKVVVGQCFFVLMRDISPWRTVAFNAV